MENANIATQNMVDPKYRYAEKKMKIVAGTFVRPPNGYRSKAHEMSDTIDEARLYRLCYIQDGQEMRADYFEYVYDTSFARRLRRNRY
jgi:hypothetical protein